jgi:organic radical activating enzyme
MLWGTSIYTLIKELREEEHDIHFHIETNGDKLGAVLLSFDYIAFSPKDEEAAIQIIQWIRRMDSFKIEYDIKIVTDLTINKELIPYATLLMPLTTFSRRDLNIRRKVWEYCSKTNLKYTPRLHYELWGKQRRK